MTDRERLPSRSQVNVVRLDETKVAIVFHMKTKENADHFMDNAILWTMQLMD